MLITRNTLRDYCCPETTSRQVSPRRGRGRTGFSRSRSRVSSTTVAGETLEPRTLLSASAVLEPNDSIAGAVTTDVNALARFYSDTAFIGDGPSFSADVDIFRVELNSGDRITFDVDTTEGPSSFDSFLRVFDAAGIERAFSDDDTAPGEIPSLDSWIDFVAPHTGAFFVGVSGYGNFAYDPFLPGSGTSGDTGSYDLHIELFPLVDDFGNTPFESAPLEVFGGMAFASGSIESTGDRDVFAIPILQDGQLVVRQVAEPDSEFDPYLRLLTPTGSPIAENDDDEESLNSLVEISVFAGTTVFVEAGAYEDSTGNYQVLVSLIAAPADSIGNSVETAVDLELNGEGAGFVDGEIEEPGDRDVFRIEATENGQLRVRQSATPGSPLDTFVRVLDSEGRVIAQNDDDAVSLNSLVQFPVTAGTVLFVEAGAFGDSVGTYRVEIDLVSVVADDFPNGLPGAPLPLDRMGRAQRPGEIEFSGDRDVFRVTAGETGLLEIRQRATPGSNLDSFLRVLDEDGDELAVNDDDGVSLNSFLQIPVVRDQVLFIEAGAFGPGRGRYELIVSTGAPVLDDAGDTRATAVTLMANPNGGVVRPGGIDRPGDRDVFRFTPTTSGFLTVRQRAGMGSFLDTFVRVLDADGQQLAENDDDGFSLNSRVTVPATAGQTLFIEAGAFGQDVGGYVLEIEPLAGLVDDFGNDLSSATVLNGEEIRGEINASGDVDVFQVEVRNTGLLTIRQRATRDSSVDSFLRVLDSDGEVLTFNDDDRFSLNSVATVSVTAGQTIFVEAGAFSTSTGRYVLTVSAGADDFGDVLNDTATVIDVSNGGSGSRNGRINFGADADVFQFTPERDSIVTVELNAGSDTQVDPFLQILSSDEELIRVDDDGGDGLNSRVTFDVKAGETYFVRASAFGDTTGAYQLLLSSTFELDDVGNTFPDARTFVLDATGAGGDQFRLNGLSDVDVLQFVATAPGDATLVIEQDSGTVPGRILVFGQVDDPESERTRVRVARDSDSDGLLTFSVTEGTTYFVEVAEGTGSVDLQVTTTTADEESKIDDDVAGDAADLFRLGLASILVGETDETSLGVFSSTLEEVAAFIRDKLGSDEPLLILGLDPVDYVVTDPTGRAAGFTATDGEINEVGNNVFNSGDGVAELLIVRNPSGNLFQLDLVGVGTEFRGGAAYITSEGIQTTSFDGTLTKGNLEVALDFSNTETSAPTQTADSTEIAIPANFLASISDDIADLRSSQVSLSDVSIEQSATPLGLSEEALSALVEDLSSSAALAGDGNQAANDGTAAGESTNPIDRLVAPLLSWLTGEGDDDQDADLVDRTWQDLGLSILDFSSGAIEMMSELLHAATEKAAETDQAEQQSDEQPDDSNTASDDSERAEPKRVSSTESNSEGKTEAEAESEEKPVTTARANATQKESATKSRKAI